MVPFEACVGSFARLLAELLIDWLELLLVVDSGAELAGSLETLCVDDIDAAELLIGFEDAGVVDPPPPPPPHAVNTNATLKHAAPLANWIELFIRTPSLLSFWDGGLLTNVTGYLLKYTDANCFQIV